MINKIILVGRLGHTPEVRHLDNGNTVANFTLATSEVYNKDGEKKEETQWHRIVLWKNNAELAERYLKKGDMIYLEGKIKTRSYEKDGETKYLTEIVGDRMTFLGKGNSANQTPSGAPTVEVPAKEDFSGDDALPF